MERHRQPAISDLEKGTYNFMGKVQHRFNLNRMLQSHTDPCRLHTHPPLRMQTHTLATL